MSSVAHTELGIDNPSLGVSPPEISLAARTREVVASDLEVRDANPDEIAGVAVALITDLEASLQLAKGESRQPLYDNKVTMRIGDLCQFLEVNANALGREMLKILSKRLRHLLLGLSDASHNPWIDEVERMRIGMLQTLGEIRVLLSN